MKKGSRQYALCERAFGWRMRKLYTRLVNTAADILSAPATGKYLVKEVCTNGMLSENLVSAISAQWGHYVGADPHSNPEDWFKIGVSYIFAAHITHVNMTEI